MRIAERKTIWLERILMIQEREAMWVIRMTIETSESTMTGMSIWPMFSKNTPWVLFAIPDIHIFSGSVMKSPSTANMLSGSMHADSKKRFAVLEILTLAFQNSLMLDYVCVDSKPTSETLATFPTYPDRQQSFKLRTERDPSNPSPSPPRLPRHHQTLTR